MKYRSLFIGGILIAFVWLDFITLTQGSYQTYFNSLSPRPATHFTESNIDWNQHIPHHLQRLAPASKPVKEYLEFLLDEKQDVATFRTASMELNSIWRHPLGVIFRGLNPHLSITGHEFHRMSKEQLFQLMMERPPFHPSQNLSFKKWDEPFHFVSQCDADQSFKLKSQVLYSIEPLVEKIHNTDSRVDFDIPLSFSVLKPSLVVMESNEAMDLSLGVLRGLSPRGSLEEYQHYSYWLPYTPSQHREVAQLSFQRRTKKDSKDIKARLLVFWGECVS